MSNNNEQNFNEALTQLRRSLKQKNQIINHLTIRLKNQQKQIDILVLDAQDKHHHQITKYYKQTYEKYMKNGKYLLLRLDEVQGNGIYLPKYAKIVHFGEIQLLRDKTTNSQNSLISENANVLTETKSRNKNIENIENEQKIRDNMTPNKQQKQNITLENSCKGLSMQIELLKQKLKAYTLMVAQNKASKLQGTQNPNLLSVENPKLNIKEVQSVIKDGTKTPRKNEGMQINGQLKIQGTDDNYYVSRFPSPSPIKKRTTTKIIRKR